MSRNTWIALLGLLAVAGGAYLFTRLGGDADMPVGLGALRVPEGFTVELAAGPDLVQFGMMATFDERGRLFVCESSGRNVRNDEMKANPEYRIRLLEDTNGDGRFDTSKVFAEKLTQPAGVVWFQGSLFVASPPDLLRYDDTDGDGVSDHREVILTGWNLSANAASLHGPILGPDGWLYLTDGRHGYKIQTKEGTVVEGKASRIWRCRPDGTGLEWVSGGGFDNPVEVAFTPSGDTIGTMTYFTDPRDGMRDALLHFVEGGVYPKWHPFAAEFQRTGELMPVMTKFARIAPSGLMRYEGDAWGAEFKNNLYSAQFNPHRVQRHQLFRTSATFRTEDEDFLTSLDPDFHPTDVWQDADGSILVMDTGAWFIHGCPVSRISKPEIRGGIYRIRKKDAVKQTDPRGLNLEWNDAPHATIAARLEDPRPAVRTWAQHVLAGRGMDAAAAVGEIRRNAADPEARAGAVFTLARMGAADALREALDDKDPEVRVAAARMLGMARDEAALDRLIAMAKAEEPQVRRQAATAAGQIALGRPHAARTSTALLAAAADAEDRFIEHSIIWALLRMGQTGPLAAGLRDPNERVRKAALIALDQMERSPLRREQVIPLLSDTSRELSGAALWVASRHADWSRDVIRHLESRLRAAQLGEDDATTVRAALLEYCPDSQVQGILAGLATDVGLATDRRLLVLDVFDRCPVQQFPKAWEESLARALDAQDNAVRLRAVSIVRTRAIAGMEDKLQQMAASDAGDALRVAALGALVTTRPEVTPEQAEYLFSRLASDVEATLRMQAAQIIARTKLSGDLLEQLAAEVMPKADALALPALLTPFTGDKSESVGRALVAALGKSDVSLGDTDIERLEKLLGEYPDALRGDSAKLIAAMRAGHEQRFRRLKELEPLLRANGDTGRGRTIFFGSKVACSECHTIGMEGGHVGPDLTAIGAIRSGPDLLEAIIFPSASFVPGHEIFRVATDAEVFSGVIGERNDRYVLLVTGPGEQVRIPRSKIVSMDPSPVSLMPDGLDEALTRQELTDLLAFLQAQTTRPEGAAPGGR
jgi:putative membrane-bound dehydrogenase-like protein